MTIKLNEFTFKNVFSDFDSLFTKLFSFYKNELLTQIYRIILNMDLIGNPINLIEGLGTGIFEFFNEPRKGLLKGPEEFGIGIAKGARSLVSNIVGGVLGIIKGGIIVFVIAAMVRLSVILGNDEMLFFNFDAIDKTIIFKHLYQIVLKM